MAMPGRSTPSGSFASRRSQRLRAGSPVAEHVFAEMFEEARDAILLIDPETERVVRANRAVERDLGHDPRALVGRPAATVLPPDVAGAGAKLLTRIRQRGAPLGEHQLGRADGTIIRMDVHASIIAGVAGDLIVVTLRDVSERAAAREELRRSEQRLELVLHGADLGWWDWNIETNAIAFNARAAEMVGYRPDELQPHARTWTTLVHPDDRERVEALMQAHLRGETPYYESEHRLRMKSGVWVWVLHRGTVVRRDAQGRPVQAVGTQFDISDRKRREEERTALLEMAREISGTLDLDGLVELVQRRTAAVLPAQAVATFYWDTDSEAYQLLSHHGMSGGLGPAERVSFPLGAVFGGRLAAGETLVVERPEDWGAREQAALTRFGIGSFAGVPLVVRGQVRGAFVAGSPPGAPPFSPNQVRFLEVIGRQLAVAIETAALYRAQQEETQHSAALARVGQELISSLARPDVYGDLCRVTTAVLDCDVSSTFLWSSREGAYLAAASYGETPEGWEALRVMRLTPAMAGTLLAAFAPTGLVRLDRLPEEDPVRRAITGAHGLTAAIVVPLWRGGDIVGFHCAGTRRRGGSLTRNQERIARGIAQLASLALESARLVGELERASRIKSDFVATMSHELRTPLNVIIGYHDLLLEGEFGALTAAQTERLRRADQSARELLDLINATLDLSRLEARQMALQMDDVDLSGMLNELDGEVGPLRQKSGVRFVWRLPEQLPAVRTDPVKLKVVLKNLIQNALKFTDAGRVTVAVTTKPGRIQFDVDDTGIGIAPELLGAIFEPFRQADSSSTRSYGGVGLGLYIVQRLLDLLGGGITVESEVGRGSHFQVWIPLEGA